MSLCVWSCLWSYGFSNTAQAQEQAKLISAPDRVLEFRSTTNPAPLIAQSFASASMLRNVMATSDGILLVVNGNPQVGVQRIVNPDRIVMDLQGTAVMPGLHNSVIPINRYGVRQIRVAQFQKNPAITRVVLDFDPNDENSRLDWRSTFNPIKGGILLAPIGSSNVSAPAPSLPQPVPDPSGSNPVTAVPTSGGNVTGTTVIQTIALTNSGQLLIQANQGLSYRGSADPSSNTYNLSISSAQISPQLQRPVLPANSPVERVRLTQIGSTVVVGLKVAPGWQIRENNSGNPQQIAFQLVRSGTNPTTQVPAYPNSGNNPIPINPQIPLPSYPIRGGTPTPVPSPSFPPSRAPSFPNNPIPNRGRGIVVVDPGHGGPDVGAVGNGIYEKNVVLQISLQLGRYLQQMGYAVVYTRTEDRNVELQPRVDLAEQVRANVFVSVHANSLESRLSSVSGVETYFAPGASRGQQLAAAVHQQIISLTGARDRTVKSARFFVIRKTSMPSILVETGFVTNPQEAANLNNRAYQDRMALAIARGVDQFMRYYNR